MPDDDECKFLHDMSNQLAIGYGNVRVLHAKLSKDLEGADVEEIFSRLGKAMGALEEVNQLLSDRRELVRVRDQEP